MEVEMDTDRIENSTMEINKSTMELIPQHPQIDESKLNCILQGPTRPFPGNASTMEYFHVFLTEYSIHSKIALIFEEHQHTFDELDKISTKLALAIRSLVREKELKNSNPDSDWVIGLCIPPSDKLIFCIFAIHKLGAAYVPIDNTFPENRILGMVGISRPILIISDSLPTTFSKFDVVADQTEIINLDILLEKTTKMELTKVIPFYSNIKSLAERVAIVMFTSGSSGVPKGVRLTHRTMMNRLFWQWETFPYIENENCCFKSAFTFVDSVPEIFGPLLRGYAIHIFSKLIISNPNLLIKKLDTCQITRIVVVPSLLRSILSTFDLLQDDDELVVEKLKSMKLWVSSGEILHKELVDDFFHQFPRNVTLCNFYGSTEIMGDVTYEVFNSAEDVAKTVDGNHVPIGSSTFNTIVYILDDELNVTPEGDTGELYVAGFNICSGYVGINNSDKFIDNPYSSTIGFDRLFRTGDFVRIDNKYGRRTLFYEGRSDSQVKVRGHRVDLNEIESVLNSQNDLIQRVILLCYNPGKDDQSLVAFIIPTQESITIEEIGILVKNSLKPYEIPELKLIPEIPLLVNGKVDRQRLLAIYEVDRKKYGAGVCSDSWNLSDLPPEMMNQARALVEAISEVTKVPQSEVVENFDDSFFNLGGNSLNSVCVVTRLRLKNFHISLDDFINAKTMLEMVPKIAATLPNKPGTINTGGNKRHHKYSSEFLGAMHEIEATQIIAFSFSRKGDLEVYTNASHQDFKELMRVLYPTLQKKGFSFIVRRKEDKKCVAVALNFDLYDEPHSIPAAPGILTVFDFLEYIESRQKDKLPKGRKKILHSFMMGTHEDVSEAENVSLITFMEEEITRIAKEKKFEGVMTTNTNPLTMQVCSEILGYETLVEYQINQYSETDGNRPFRLAPDSQTVICCWKKVAIEKKPAAVAAVSGNETKK